MAVPLAANSTFPPSYMNIFMGDSYKSPSRFAATAHKNQSTGEARCKPLVPFVACIYLLSIR